MKKGILLILLLLGAIAVTSTVGTLSAYTTQSSFGVDIVTDFRKSH